MKNESTALDRQRNKLAERGRNRPWYFVFCCSSCMWLLVIPFSHICGRYGPSSQNSPKNGCRIFRPVSTSLSLVSYQLFFGFLSHIHSKGLSTRSFFSQSQPADDLLLIHFYFNLSVCFYHDLDFGNPLSTFLFVFFLVIEPPLSLLLPLFSFSHMSLLFYCRLFDLKFSLETTYY